jgi:hypothetical protein
MREYEDMSIKVGDKVTIEIKKADTSGIWGQHSGLSTGFITDNDCYYLVRGDTLHVLGADFFIPIFSL